MCTLFSIVRIFRPLASSALTIARLLLVMWRKPFSVHARPTRPLDCIFFSRSWPIGPSIVLRACA
jgi:hypothetical protein